MSKTLFLLRLKEKYMWKINSILSCFLIVVSCKTAKNIEVAAVNESDFTIAFGSCNKHNVANLLWDDISQAKPNIWVWGGDIVYADTDDMTKLKAVYDAQNAVLGYQKLKNEMPVIGTWDDHDYGLNDGGVAFGAKKESQQEFLDFMGVAKNSPRRSQEGVYTAHDYTVPQGKVKVIILDTRYFRTALTPDTETKKRNKPNAYGVGTMLGEKQWKWLQQELFNSDADFNVLVSSVQFLSNEHGFECWGNFPHEVDRLKKMIADSKAKGVLILSGDRHISEFSKTQVNDMRYPLVDFTSSGLTHVYSKFKEEANPYRVGEVVSKKSFGLVHFNFKQRKATFKIVGNNGEVFGELQQAY